MRLLLTWLFCLSAILSIAQKKQLIIENRNDKTQTIISNGYPIKLINLKGDDFRGNLNIVNDSVISLGSKTFDLKTIKKISIPTTGSKMFKAIVITTGAVTYVSAGAIGLATIIGVSILSNGYGAEPLEDVQIFNSIKNGIDGLMEVKDTMEKSFPADSFSYRISQ